MKGQLGLEAALLGAEGTGRLAQSSLMWSNHARMRQSRDERRPRMASRRRIASSFS
jgi:hypothetical protein